MLRNNLGQKEQCRKKNSSCPQNQKGSMDKDLGNNKMSKDNGTTPLEL